MKNQSYPQFGDTIATSGDGITEVTKSKETQEISHIQSAFDATLRDANLESITENVTELSIDSLLKDGILKEVPIVSTMVSLVKLGANVQDRLFLKKIVSFMAGLNEISPEERRRMIDKIDAPGKQRIKVGEKLLYVIDACNDHESSELVAHLFKVFVEEKITYDEFLQGSNILNKITGQDFRWFLSNARNYMSAEDVGSLISSGLFDLYYEPVNVRVKDQDDYKMVAYEDKYKTEVDGGEMKVTISQVGKIIMLTFGEKKI